MAKKQEGDLVETLRSRGLTCAKLKSLERNKQKDAKLFRSVGFTGRLAQREEQSARDIRSLRNQVCKLR